MNQQRIASEADMATGVAVLAEQCSVFARMLAETGPPPLRLGRAGFDGLAWIIVSQQLSVASANAIWARVEAGFAERTPSHFLAADDASLRAAGLSAPKIRTLRAVSEAIVSGALDLDALAHTPPDEAQALMTAVKGIGPWTADIYLMFCLGHADAFAPGDLALQEAVRLAFRLPERPSARELALIAERWRPWRAVAARVLWAYYKVAKAREGIGA
jgi:DNA-3-methyladenine glycosylase II